MGFAKINAKHVTSHEMQYKTNARFGYKSSMKLVGIIFLSFHVAHPPPPSRPLPHTQLCQAFLRGKRCKGPSYLDVDSLFWWSGNIPLLHAHDAELKAKRVDGDASAPSGGLQNGSQEPCWVGETSQPEHRRVRVCCPASQLLQASQEVPSPGA